MRRFAIALLCAQLGGGCAVTTAGALERTVLAYDRTIVGTVSQLLLVNVARVHRDLPPHFTAVASIAANYDFRVNAGIGPAMTGDLGFIPMPTVGGTFAESPTMTITPMQGDEFTNRLLTPFDEAKAALLLGQQYDVDALLRLLGDAVRVGTGATERVMYNRPTDREGYARFRRVMAHLSSVQDRNALHVAPLCYQLHRVVPAASYAGADVREHAADPSFRYDPARQVFEFDSQVTGRTLISNYDLEGLSNDERAALQAEAEHLRPNEVLLDVRAGHVGGEVPLHGVLRLRSFMNVLAFVARGIAAEPEFDVAPDPRTPGIQENPTRSLAIVEAAAAPPGAALWARLGDRVYAVAPDRGYAWNRKAFSILYQLFQMTVAPSRTPLPLISVGGGG